MKLPDWNEKEFLAFVLLYGANFDLEYSKEEKEIIHGLLDQKHYTAVSEVFNSLNDIQCIELITAFKGLYYPTPERSEELIEKLDQLLGSDGTKNIENGCRAMLNRLL